MIKGDLRAKLGEANVLHFSQVRAVVMETKGNPWVLHHADGTFELSNALLEEVGGRENLV